MEAASVESVAANNGNVDGAEVEAERSPAETRDSSRLFEFSQFVHVGPAAESCADADNGECSNTSHFHAWIRLPNPFQRQSIAEKAAAARARRRRLLLDPESDARTILDEGIERMVSADDRDGLIDEIVNKEFLQDHLKAMRSVSEEDEYEHIEEDQERLRAEKAKAPEDRDDDAEEFEALEKHVAAFSERVNAERELLQAPLRESLKEKSIEEVAEIAREDRIERASQGSFNETYNMWEWYVGTLKPRPAEHGLPTDRIFGSIDLLKGCAPEVYEALDTAYTQLEAAQGRLLNPS